MKKLVIGDATLPPSAIYQIKNTVTGKLYVGSAVNYRYRWRQHRSALARGIHNQKMQAAWNKYGADAFEFSVLEYVSDKSQLIEREQVWIDTLCVVKNGYNCSPTAGSPLGMKHSEETRRKLSISLRGRKMPPCSEEAKAKISATQKGRKKPPITDAHRAALSRTSKGRKMPPRTEEFKALVARTRTGTKASEETKAKMSEIHKARWAKLKEAANGI